MASVSFDTRRNEVLALEVEPVEILEDEEWKKNLLVARGFPLPLGLSAKGEGANFAVYSREEEEMALVLIPPKDYKDSQKVEIALNKKFNRTGQVWHVLVAPYPTGFSYMYRVGNAATSRWKQDLVFDPMSQALNSPIGPESFNNHGGPYKPMSYVLPQRCSNFDWQGVLPPKIPMKDLIIYEMHVRGFTMSPDSHVNSPGTYLGVIEKIPYLKSLGVNCIELLPVFEYNETEWDKKNPFTGKKLCQYWGYSTVNFFSPMNRFAAGGEPYSAVDEFKTMVRELHRAGIEVFLDVVFNHTAEFGDVWMGPGFFHFKGLALDTYYIRQNGHFYDYTGCGNSVNLNNPITAEWFHQCIRHWVHEMGVDGFRFDLAAALTRGSDGTPLSSPPAIERITKDPTLRNIKLIAEPWDAVGLYQVGSFPHYGAWGEWNGKYRDCMRRFIKGDGGLLSEFATRVCGSGDLYSAGRKPYHSINFVVAHDGFSLYDLCSYNDKHNDENGENNNDGEKHNNSWNCGAEGETGSGQVMGLRYRQCKNFMVVLMVSAGTPMILMGDEYFHTKGGNNNAWCQDQQKNYFHWTMSADGKAMRRFTEKMIEFRKRHPFLMRDQFVGSDAIKWHGAMPYAPDWSSTYNFIAFTMVDKSTGNDLYVAFNAGHHSYGLTLPDRGDGRGWYRIVDTNLKSPEDFVTGDGNVRIQGGYQMAPYSSIILKALPSMEAEKLTRVKSFRKTFSRLTLSNIESGESAGVGLGILNSVAPTMEAANNLRKTKSTLKVQVPRSFSRFDIFALGQVDDDEELPD